MSLQEVAPSQAREVRLSALKRITRRLAVTNSIAMGVLWLITLLVAALFIYIIISLIVQGASTLISPTFYGTSDAGIAPELFNTFYILILTELILVPLSLAAAIYLVEYSPQGRFITVIHFAAETITGAGYVRLSGICSVPSSGHKQACRGAHLAVLKLPTCVAPL
jgi:phosphate transport system permease protein